MDNYFDNKSEEPEMFEPKYTDPNAGYNSYSYGTNENKGYNINYDNNSMDMTPMSMGDWVLTILALFIPCAGIIIYFIWAFGKKGNINRRNYCRAYLTIYGVIMIIYLIIALVFGAAFAGTI